METVSRQKNSTERINCCLKENSKSVPFGAKKYSLRCISKCLSNLINGFQRQIEKHTWNDWKEEIISYCLRLGVCINVVNVYGV